jgi:hypothetical protein
VLAGAAALGGVALLVCGCGWVRSLARASRA